MVPNIEGLGAELEPVTLSERKALEESHVPVLESGLIEDVAYTLRDERSGSWFSENQGPVGIGSGEPLAVRKSFLSPQW